jgi:transposase-like protein
MARHRSFSSEFKRQLAREFLEGRAGMHELARRYSLSRNLIRLWVRKYWSEPLALDTLTGRNWTR